MTSKHRAMTSVRPGAVIAGICAYLIVCVAIGAVRHGASTMSTPAAAALAAGAVTP